MRCKKLGVLLAMVLVGVSASTGMVGIGGRTSGLTAAGS